MKELQSDYRLRIYERYSSARGCSLVPVMVDGFKPRTSYLSKLVREHFPQNRSASILDLGCGHGALIWVARQAGYVNLRGVDSSPEQVMGAKRLGIDGVVKGDLMEALQALPDESEDCIVAFDVIEHFTKDELLVFVDEVHRVLRVGGRWLIHIPNGESPFGGRMRYGDFTHELSFTRESIMQLLLSSGFSKVECFEDTPVPHGIKSATRWILWKMIRLMLRLYIAAETGNTGRGYIFSQNFLTVAIK